MSTPQQVSNPAATGFGVQVNENMNALGQAFVWAHDITADSGLTVGYAGGNFNETTVAAGTLACTNNETNYISVNRTTLVAGVEVGTDAVNWDDTANYGRVARAVFASGVLTWYDERYSEGGIFDHGASAGGDALTSNPLSQFAATTSAQLAGVISDETGSGALVFATSPTLVTPALGTPSSGTLTNCTGYPAAALPAAPVISSLGSINGTNTIDLSTIKDGGIVRMTANGSLTLQLSNGTDGQKFILEISQDGTGSRVVTLSGTYFKFGTDITSFTATTTASKKDRVGCICTAATTADVLAVSKGYA